MRFKTSGTRIVLPLLSRSALGGGPSMMGLRWAAVLSCAPMGLLRPGPGPHILFMGDSLLRYQYLALAYQLEHGTGPGIRGGFGAEGLRAASLGVP
jgi:hypothetical protein